MVPRLFKEVDNIVGIFRGIIILYVFRHHRPGARPLKLLARPFSAGIPYIIDFAHYQRKPLVREDS